MSSIIAERMNTIKPSPTIAVTTRARELRAAGEDVIGLGAGEPDFDTPDHIKDAAIKAIEKGETKYTAVDGTPELKEAISHKFKNENNLEYKHNEIIVGCGGKQVLYNAFISTLNKGDEVLIPSPYWVSYPDMVLLAEGKPVALNTTSKSGFKIEPEKLEKSINEKTKWLILNSPSNPTGSAYNKNEIKELVGLLEKYPHVYVLSDDIYEKIIYDGFSFSTIANYSEDLKNRTLTVNGVSKAYSMTGWRIGYAGGPSSVIKEMSKVQSQSTSNPSSISQAAALQALIGDQSFLLKRNDVFKNRRNYIVKALNSIEGINCRSPEGAFYVFPDCSALFGKHTESGKTIENSIDFSSYLLESVGVAVVAGLAFGMDGFFRISYATSDENIEEACKRIHKACILLK